MNRDRVIAWSVRGVGAAWIALAWFVPQTDLAAWMRHPVRSDAAAGALSAAAWARWGWSAGGLAIVSLPSLRRAGPAPALEGTVNTRWLWLAMALAAALRFADASQGLWYDEIASLGTYVVHGPGVIAGNAFTTANHPLQSLLSWCCLPLGVEPWVRLPSILSGPAAVLGCWWIGRAVRDGTALATAMAFAAAIMPSAVNAGAEARGYGLMIAASSLSTGLWLTHDDRGGRWRRPAYAIVLALGVWAHFVTAMVGVGHAVLALPAMFRRDRRADATRELLALMCAAMLAIALWSPALPDLLRSRSQFAAIRGDEPSIFGTQGLLLLWQLAGMVALPMHKAGIDTARAVLLGIVPLVLVLVGAFDAATDRRLRRGVAAAGLGLPVAIALAWAGGSWLYARFLLFAAPASALLLCAGAMRTGRRPMVGAALTATLLATWVPFDLAAGPRQPIREAVAHVARCRDPRDRVLGIGIADDVVQWYALAYTVPIEPTGIGGEHLPETLARTDARWIVALYPGHRHPNARAEAITRLGFRRRPAHGFIGWLDAGEGTVEVWERVGERE